MTWVLIVGTIGLIIMATLALYAIGMWLYEEVSTPLAIVWAVVWTSVVAGTCVWAIANSETDGYHEWRGGSGPSTVCSYDVRSEAQTVGKVTTWHDVTYTVCRDAR